MASRGNKGGEKGDTFKHVKDDPDVRTAVSNAGYTKGWNGKQIRIAVAGAIAACIAYAIPVAR